jgi:hypothetical protein
MAAYVTMHQRIALVSLLPADVSQREILSRGARRHVRLAIAAHALMCVWAVAAVSFLFSNGSLVVMFVWMLVSFAAFVGIPVLFMIGREQWRTARVISSLLKTERISFHDHLLLFPKACRKCGWLWLVQRSVTYAGHQTLYDNVLPDTRTEVACRRCEPVKAGEFLQPPVNLDSDYHFYPGEPVEAFEELFMKPDEAACFIALNPLLTPKANEAGPSLSKPTGAVSGVR